MTVQTFGLTNQLHDFDVKVHVEHGVFVSNDQSGLQGGFAALDFCHPVLVVPHFVDDQLLAQIVVASVVFFDLSVVDDVFWEHSDWSGDFLEQMSGPNDFSGLRGHVTDDWRVLFVICEIFLDVFKICGVIVED